MIKTSAPTITLGMLGTPDAQELLARPRSAGAAPPHVPREAVGAVAPARADRLRELATHLEFLWRFVRRMGVAEAAAEDVAQEAFVIAATRLDAIVVGKERSFLLSVAMNLARRERARGWRHDELETEPPASTRERPDARLDAQRGRRLLDLALADLDDDLRVVFVLHEVEEETMASIALLLDIPPGTVASRLRRAREAWRAATARLRATGLRPGASRSGA